jgi:hypothetical protein
MENNENDALDNNEEDDEFGKILDSVSGSKKRNIDSEKGVCFCLFLYYLILV